MNSFLALNSIASPVSSRRRTQVFIFLASLAACFVPLGSSAQLPAKRYLVNNLPPELGTNLAFVNNGTLIDIAGNVYGSYASTGIFGTEFVVYHPPNGTNAATVQHIPPPPVISSSTFFVGGVNQKGQFIALAKRLSQSSHVNKFVWNGSDFHELRPPAPLGYAISLPGLYGVFYFSDTVVASSIHDNGTVWGTASQTVGPDGKFSDFGSEARWDLNGFPTETLKFDANNLFLKLGPPRNERGSFVRYQSSGTSFINAGYWNGISPAIGNLIPSPPSSMIVLNDVDEVAGIDASTHEAWIYLPAANYGLAAGLHTLSGVVGPQAGGSIMLNNAGQIFFDSADPSQPRAIWENGNWYALTLEDPDNLGMQVRLLNNSCASGATVAAISVAGKQAWQKVILTPKSDLNVISSVVPGEIKFGDTFDLTLDIRNDSEAALNNIGILVSSFAFSLAVVGDWITAPPQLLTLAPGASGTLHYIFRSKASGRALLRYRVQGFNAAGQQQALTPLLFSPQFHVLPVEKGDLLLKRLADPDSAYALDGVYQTSPAGGQIVTNSTTTNTASQFQMWIQNDGTNSATFHLKTSESGAAGWDITYLLGAQNISAAVRTAQGMVFPTIGPGQRYRVTVNMTPTDVPLGAMARANLYLSVTNTIGDLEILDAVAAVSKRVNLVGDLLIKRDIESSDRAGGNDIYQTVASGEQIRTNEVTKNELSQFQLHIQNDGTDTASFRLAASESANSGWKVEYISGDQDISSQVRSANGALFPALPTNLSYLVTVKVTPTNAPLGDAKVINLSLLDADNPSNTLDVVRAVTQTALEIIVNSTADLPDQDPDDCCPDTGRKIKDGSPEVTLRAAIEFANKHPGKDIIKFQIPADDPNYNNGTPRIVPLSGLPTIADSVRIDGHTQNPSDSSPHIEVDGYLLHPNRWYVFSEKYPDDLLKLRTIGESGFLIASTNCEIRGLAINRFPLCGILIHEFAYYNYIQGNHIGLTEGGTVPAANGGPGYNYEGYQPTGAGIVVLGPYNLIGGDSPEARNVISGSGGMMYSGSSVYGPARYLASPPGILIYGSYAYNNWVEGNIIGLDATGRRPPRLPAESSSELNPYPQSGVVIGGGAFNSVIGGAAAGMGNVIALNWEQVGIYGSNTFFNYVYGNRIGFDIDGSGVFPNYEQNGIVVHGADGSYIGSTTASSGNFVAGQRRGIWIQGTATNTYNLVAWNTVGVDPLLSLFSNDTGIQVSGIGAAVMYNEISHSRYYGLALFNASKVLVDRNDIHHNRELGVFVTTSSNNQIGDNAIHGNGSGSEFDASIGYKAKALGGILLKESTENLIDANQIYGNTGLGISLKAGNKPTPNDPGDVDSGANTLLNYPVINAAPLPPVGGATGIVARATLNTASNVAAYTVQFFASAKANPSGYGEGERFLGAAFALADSHGFASVLFQTNRSVQPGEFLTATTIATNGNTSEFSAAVLIQGPTPTASGISKEVQDNAPPPLHTNLARRGPINGGPVFLGDGDGDGIPDSQQLNICSFPSITGHWITLATATNNTLVSVAPGGPPELDDLPSGYSLPIGVINLGVTGFVAGATIRVTNLFHDPVNLSTVFAYGPTPDNPQPHWYDFQFDGSTGAELGLDQFVLTFRDGQRGDHDLQTNGVIATLIAPAFLNPTPPALSLLSHSESLLEFLSPDTTSTNSPAFTTNLLTAVASVLAWPASATNYFLESATDLSPDTTWEPVTDAAVIQGGQNIVTNLSVDPMRFYRLHPF